MTWPSVLGAVAYYIVLPVSLILNVLLRLLAPATHLASYILHALLWPLRFLARFETLYIYLGVAALIGLIAGSILHFTSSMLITILGLRPTPVEHGRTAASVREARRKKLEEPASGPSPAAIAQHNAARVEFLKEEYADFLAKGRATSREGPGLMSQTILEEDDDSDNF